MIRLLIWPEQRWRRFDQQRKAQRAEYNKRRLRTPEVQARCQLKEAVRMGKVAKPSACSLCGAEPEPRLIHGHHNDYTKPLDVVWCCSVCHGKLHRKTA